MNPVLQRASGSFAGFFKATLKEGPWKARSVIAAFAVVAMGTGLWVSDLMKQHQPKAPETQTAEAPTVRAETSTVVAPRPIPGYVRWGASYIGGFFLGWGMRRFLKLTAMVALLIGSLIVMTKLTGCDTTKLSARIERNVAAVQEKAEKERVALKGMLPSATAATIGAFLGFRRKSRIPEPAVPPRDDGPH